MRHILCAAMAAWASLALQSGCTDGEDGGVADSGGSERDASTDASEASAGDGGSGGGGSGGAGRGGGGGAGSGGEGGARSGSYVRRSFVFHEITALESGIPGIPANGILSADGRVVAFVPNGNMPNRISIIDFDGTGQREVDSYDSLVGSQAWADLSGDGSGVVSTDGVQVRYVKADGSGKATLTSLSSNEIANIRISEDGSRVFYMLGRDSSDRMTNDPIERGIYVSTPAGGGKQLVVGAAAVAALYGATPDQVFRFDACGHSLDVSADGSRIIFALNVTNPSTAGNKVLGVNSDGSGLHKIADSGGTSLLVHKVAINSDGSKVAFMTTAGDDNRVELVVADFDGGAKRVIAKTPEINFGDGCSQPLKLTSDATKVFHADVGLLFDTSGDDLLALSVPAVIDGLPLVGDRISGATMSNDGKRFVFQRADANRRDQLVTLELDAEDIGAAASIDDPRLFPNRVRRGADTGNPLLSARIQTDGTVVGIASVGLRDGRKDPTFGATVLVDNGMNGDATADDGLFSSDRVSASSDAEVGPRSLRVQVEQIVDGRRHANVVELGGIEVD